MGGFMVVIRNIKISVEDKDKSGKPSMGDTVKIERGVGKKKHVTSIPVPKFLNSPEFQFLGDKTVRAKLIGLPPMVDAKRFGETVKGQQVSARILDGERIIKLHFHYALFKNKTIKIELAT